ncbi:hypothetical protein GCM10011583_11780 [Streptomyces camponoticapitis]|uniref:Uncharacterized protein n=1 Tax=Streptomyces camponoticapitis TaxID=1616125 RepID=A0ABQ2E061_9ACTN|nr:hypothetical protein [Streptomyces camponoticapitis]GGJ81945.1 hypothetical protein GCM10011583_11780 [Streptomyces camponoticapitis]
MADKPIIPSRIIPAGQPLPPRPPQPGEAPPWRTPPPSPPAPPAAPEAPPLAIQVHVTLDLAPVPEPTWRERLWAWVARIRPWQALAALAAAVFPIPFTGHSAATTWAYTVGEARDGFGPGYGYALAGIPLAVVVWRLVRKGGTFLRVFGLAVFLVGLTGAISLYDPVTWITGVTP